MVHPVTLEVGVWTREYGPQMQERIRYGLDVWYIIASILFVIGSCFFIDDTVSSMRWGCWLYDAGSIMFAMGALLFLAESHWFARRAQAETISPRKTKSSPRPSPRMRRRRSSRSAANAKRDEPIGDQLLYCLGSIVFLLGTLMWDPTLRPFFVSLGGSSLAWGQAADVLFMMGSFMFSFASFVTALSIYKVHQLFKASTVILVSCYEFGGFCFIAGTMAYMPGFNCDERLPRTGGVLFLAGSWLYLLGCVLSLFKTVGTYQVAKEHWRSAAKLQNAWKRNRFAVLTAASASMDIAQVAGASGESPAAGGCGVSPFSGSAGSTPCSALPRQPGATPESKATALARVFIERSRRLAEERRRQTQYRKQFGEESPSIASSTSGDESDAAAAEWCGALHRPGGDRAYDNDEYRQVPTLRAAVARAWRANVGPRRSDEGLRRRRIRNQRKREEGALLLCHNEEELSPRRRLPLHDCNGRRSSSSDTSGNPGSSDG